MKIDVPKIPAEGTSYEGEDPAEILDLEQDKYVRAAGPVRYRFFVQKMGTEVVVQGTLGASLKMLCGRCGGFFDRAVEDIEFIHSYEVADTTESLDLAEDIREDVLLALPAYPKCTWQGEGVCPFSGVNLGDLIVPETPVKDQRWAALDGLVPAEKPRKKSGKGR